MEDGQKGISNIFGGKPVEYCYNPTAMAHDEDAVGYLGDLTQAGAQKLGRITQEVRSLVRHLKEAIERVGKNGRVIHIAHSQGALLTFLATKQLSPLEMSKLEIITFGGAAALRKTPQTPFARVINYYSVNDPLLLVVPMAAQALRSGFVGDEEFCFLAPRGGDPIRDHDLFGPTYVRALTWEGKRFKRHYQPLLYRTLRPLVLFVWTLISVLSERLDTVLKDFLRWILQVILAVWLLVEPHLTHSHSLTLEHVFKPSRWEDHPQEQS